MPALARGHDRVGERGDPEEQQRDGQAVGAGLEHARKRDVGATGLGARPR